MTKKTKREHRKRGYRYWILPKTKFATTASLVVDRKQLKKDKIELTGDWKIDWYIVTAAERAWKLAKQDD